MRLSKLMYAAALISCYACNPTPAAHGAANGISKAKANALLQPAMPDPADFLKRTEAFVRPIRNEERRLLIDQLTQLDLAAAAQRISGPSAAAAAPASSKLMAQPADCERLARLLIQFGEFDAADAVFMHWQRLEPRAIRLPFVRGLLHHARGELELARRDLEQAMATAPSELIPLLRLQAAILRLPRTQPGDAQEPNPWGVRFADESGKYVAGGIAAAERLKLPEGVGLLLTQLTEMLCRQGNLWVLCGELYNAAGFPESGLECFRRATGLQHDSRALRDHRRVLEASVRAARRAADEALNAATDFKPTQQTTDAADIPTIDSPRKAWAVLGIGIAFIALVFGFQIRAWVRGARRRGNRPPAPFH